MAKSDTIRALYQKEQNNIFRNIFFHGSLKPLWRGVNISIVVEIFSIDQRAGLSIYLAIVEAPIKTHASTEPTSLVHNNALLQEFVYSNSKLILSDKQPVTLHSSNIYVI